MNKPKAFMRKAVSKTAKGNQAVNSFIPTSSVLPFSDFIPINNYSTTLGAPLSVGSTTMTVASVDGLPTSIPSGSAIELTLNDVLTGELYEIVYASAISGNTITVSRAQEGTAALNWDIGDDVYCAFTAATGAVATGNPNNRFKVADAVRPNEAVSLSQLNTGQLNKYGVDTGTPNNYQISLNPPVTVLTDGLVIYFKASNTNTGDSTLSVEPLGTHPIRAALNVPLEPNTITAGNIYSVVYSAGTTNWLLIGQTGGGVMIDAGQHPNQAIRLGQFTQVATVSGFTRNPNGYFEQWGRAQTGGANNQVAVVFPVAYVNPPVNISLTALNSGAGPTSVPNVVDGTITVSGFTMQSSIATAVFWRSIGFQ